MKIFVLIVQRSNTFFIPSQFFFYHFTYLLSSPALHTCTPVAAKPHMQRFIRLLPSTLSPPVTPITLLLVRILRCDSRVTRIICRVEPSFISRAKPTPESQPLECNDGTDVSKFEFLSIATPSHITETNSVQKKRKLMRDEHRQWHK